MNKTEKNITGGRIKLGVNSSAPIIYSIPDKSSLALRNATDTEYSIMLKKYCREIPECLIIRDNMLNTIDIPYFAIREAYDYFPEHSSVERGYDILSVDVIVGGTVIEAGTILWNQGLPFGVSGLRVGTGTFLLPLKDMQVAYDPSVWMFKDRLYISEGVGKIHDLHEATTNININRVEIPIESDGKYRSSLILPSTAKINKCEVEIIEAYSAGSSISVGDETTPDCILVPQLCNPETVNKYTLKSGMSWTITSKVVVTCIGAGTGIVTVWFSNN